MAIFQGENLAFKIVIKDEDGLSISTDDIDSITAKLYNEGTSKVYIQYTEGVGDTGILDRSIVAAADKSGFEFEIYAVDSAVLIPGRYIIQIEYKTTDTSFPEDSNKKVTIQKGALISIKKVI